MQPRLAGGTGLVSAAPGRSGLPLYMTVRADWGYVLDSGRITLQGPPQTLLRDERIRATYMGIAAVPQDLPGGVSD